MLKKRMNWWVQTAILVLPLLWLGGCIDYTIETTLNVDGSGVRDERMEVSSEEDSFVSRTEFTELMSVTPRSRWEHHAEVDEDGDSVQVFERHTEISDLASWSGLSDHVRIYGALPAMAGSNVGYVLLGEVRFRNRVQVGFGRVSGGSTSYTYRETFRWENALDALVEAFVQIFDGFLESQYPDLSSRDRGEIVGFARARLWNAVDDGVLVADGDEEDALIAMVVDGTTEHALKILRVSHPEAEEDSIRDFLDRLLEDDGDLLDTFLNETVPGLQLSFNTNIVFRLNMPGRVTDSNADETDGTTLVWEFSPTEAIQAAVEIYAESARGPDQEG